MNPQTSTMSNYYTGYVPNKILSYMGRVNYGLKGKYLLTFAMRADGASVLSEGKKWDYFPSAALAWNISKENFMKSISTINNLKFRLSYGLVGNAAIPPFTTLGALKTTNYSWDETVASGYAYNSLPNKGLTWEETQTYNAGIDFAILGNRISGVIEGYIANTYDILLNRKPIPSSGYSSTTVNLGKVQNKGIEITLNTIVVDNKDFKWNIDLTFSSNREEIVDLYGDQKDDIGNRWFIGHPINTFYDFKKIGVWQLGEEAEAMAANDENPGDIRVQNVDSNPAITADDMQIIGTPNSKFSAGLNSTIVYKGFDLSAYIFTRYGGTITSTMLAGDTENFLNTRNNVYNVDYWTPENPTNAYPRPYYYKSNMPFASTLRYWDGSFIKVKNITLGYNAPQKFNDKIYLKALRVLLTIQNPFMWAKYPYDPEAPVINSKSNDLTTGMVGANIPTPRSFILGINVSF
jgi:TonB-linked SusC/RagA family outer membrane protein